MVVGLPMDLVDLPCSYCTHCNDSRSIDQTISSPVSQHWKAGQQCDGYLPSGSHAVSNKWTRLCTPHGGHRPRSRQQVEPKPQTQTAAAIKSDGGKQTAAEHVFLPTADAGWGNEALLPQEVQELLLHAACLHRHVFNTVIKQLELYWFALPACRKAAPAGKQLCGASLCTVPKVPIADRNKTDHGLLG